MLRRIKSILICTFVLCLVLSSSSTAEVLPSATSEMYSAQLEMLNTYLQKGSGGSSGLDIYAIHSTFEQNGNIGIFSTEFKIYTEVLCHIEEEDFEEAAEKSKNLQTSSSFIKFREYLTDSQDLQARGLFAIGTVEELNYYVAARQFESHGLYDEAMQQYDQCQRFFDSYKRMQTLSASLGVQIQNKEDGYLGELLFADGYARFEIIKEVPTGYKLFCNVTEEYGNGSNKSQEWMCRIENPKKGLYELGALGSILGTVRIQVENEEFATIEEEITSIAPGETSGNTNDLETGLSVCLTADVGHEAEGGFVIVFGDSGNANTGVPVFDIGKENTVQFDFLGFNLKLENYQFRKFRYDIWVEGECISSAYVDTEEELRSVLDVLSTCGEYGIRVSANTSCELGETWVAYYTDLELISTSLQRGDSGEAVREMQSELIRYGFLQDKADGKFGANTENAVKSLQRYVGVTVTGVADETVFQALDSFAKVVKCEENISLRSEPLYAGELITPIPLGDYVYVINTTNGDFAKVKYKDQVGYCLSYYLEFE